MHIQKRNTVKNICDSIVRQTSVPNEQINKKYWRRFMNERIIDRSYIPTTYGMCILASSMLIKFQ